MASDASNARPVPTPTSATFAPSHSRDNSTTSPASPPPTPQATSGASDASGTTTPPSSSLSTATTLVSTPSTTPPSTPAESTSDTTLLAVRRRYHNHAHSQTQTPRQRQRPRPNLEPILTRLRYPLAPLHPLPEGAPHPSFPSTLLSYHLLTEDQLDSLARYYHQLTSPNTQQCVWTHGYPTMMENYNTGFLGWLGERKGSETRLRAKRRMWGRFIGLRGCEVSLEECEERERWERRREEARVKGIIGRW